MTPFRLLLTLALAIFVTEILVMYLLDVLPILSLWQDALVDASVLVVVTFPVLYFFVYKPVFTNLAKLRESEARLRQMGANLESLVERRTAEVNERNEELKREVMERSRAEEEARKSKERLELIVETIAEGIYIVDAEGRITFANKAAEKMFGLSREEIYARTFNDQRWKVFKPNGEPLGENDYPFTIVKKTARPVWGLEMAAVKPQGMWGIYSINAAPIYDPLSGAFMGMVATQNDITKRKAAERALKDSEERLKGILNNTTSVVYLKDTDGKFIIINRRFEELFNVRQETIKGKTDYDLFPREMADVFHANDLKVIETRTPVESEEVAPHEDGPHTYISVKFPLINENGVVYAVGGISTDITERKKAEEWLQRLYEAQSAINSLLHIAQEDITLDQVLNRALELLGSVSWLTLEKGSGIFLAKGESVLTLEAQRGLPPPILKECAMVPFGTCLCGLAAETQKAQYSGDIDDRHRIQYKGLVPHGHYCIPIVFSGKTLGVLNTHLAVGHPRRQEEEEFLTTFANALAGIITQKRAEESLKESELRYRALMSDAGDAIVIADLNGNIIEMNKKACELLGCSGGECAMMTIADISPASEMERVKAEFGRLLETGSVTMHDAFVLHRSGRIIPVDITGNVIEYAGKKVALGIFRDITERKRAEAELRAAHLENEQLITAIPSILIGVDTMDNITKWNKKAEEVFGVKAAEIIGKPFLDSRILWNWEEVTELISQLREGREISRVPDIHYYAQRSGKGGVLGVTFAPIYTDKGEWNGFLLMGTDITERRMMESQLAQAQKLESIGQLAAGIAHEINTPIQYVGDNIRFLDEAFKEIGGLLAKYAQLRAALGDEAHLKSAAAEVSAMEKNIDITYLRDEAPKAIRQSLDGVKRVADIVRAMKEFSHPGVKEKAAVDIKKAIESAVTVTRNEWKYVAEMVTDIDRSLPSVLCIPGELNQVILNLIVNAAHAIADVVGDGSKGKGTITISARRTDGFAEIRVSDTGTGIPASIRHRIFDPFFTTKEVGRGTGQGLALAYSTIVDKHGGSISFETEVGKGTTFIIRLPLGDV